jgi:hypothetical protein
VDPAIKTVATPDDAVITIEAAASQRREKLTNAWITRDFSVPPEPPYST